MATENTQDLIPKIVTVSVIAKLGSVRGINGPIRPEMYTTKTRNEKEEGTPVGEFRAPVFMNTKKVLSPLWDNILQRWQFAGDYATFTRLVKAMGLRYGDNHPNARGRIKTESLEAHRSNRLDPVFQNAEVLGKFVLENGKGVLRTDNPMHEFLYHCFRDSRRFIDETTSGKPANYPGAEYRMTATNRKNLALRKDVNQRLQVSGLLARIANDEPRLRAICALTKIPGYSPLSDLNGMVVLLDEQINNGADRLISSQGNRRFLDVLLEYMEMEDSSLKYEHDIMRAYHKGILRGAVGGVNLQGTFLVGPTNFKQTVKYFQDPANQDTYFELTVALGSKD